MIRRGLGLEEGHVIAHRRLDRCSETQERGAIVT
jgi:hypothetical protein